MQGVRPFEEIVEEYGAAVFRICRSMLGITDAEDAWSETFLSALRAYPDLSPGTPVEAWLVTIARNRSVDIHRARKRRAVPVAELPELPVSGNFPDGGDHEILILLAGLPPKQRRSVTYHYLAGLPYSEVAEVLGGSEAAARRAAADGIAALRREYVPESTRKGASR
jgi:RNA polymerase sigma factor (sigma-70 family)